MTPPTQEKTMEWKMKHEGMTYLNKEIRKQRKELDNRLRQKSIEPITHARACDMLRWLQKRIEVAKLVDKDALASSQDSFRRKVEEEKVNALKKLQNRYKDVQSVLEEDETPNYMGILELEIEEAEQRAKLKNIK